MGSGLEILAWTALAGTVANTGVQLVQGEKERQRLDNEAGRAASRAQAQQDALKKQQEDAANQEAMIRTRDAQSARARVAALGKQGRSGTMLTGPMGVPGGGAAPAPSAGGKTILGA